MTDTPQPEDLAQFLSRYAEPKQASQPAVDAAATIAKFQQQVGAGQPLRLGSAGLSVAQEQGYIDPGPAWYNDLSELTQDEAEQHHILALAADTGAEEVEALAVSLWPQAGWAAANRLHLTGQAYALGPYKLPRSLGTKLGFSAERTRLFLIECPRVRGGAIPPEIRGNDPFSQAFAAAEPYGLEREVCEGLVRIARRLGGAIRYSDSGVIMTPDPDSAVTMTVFTPALLPVEQLLPVLRAELPELQLEDTQVAPDAASELLNVDRTVEDFRGIRAAATAAMNEAARRSLHERADAMDQYYLTNPEAIPGYAMQGQIERGARIGIYAGPMPQVPPILRWEPWAQADLYSYHLQWLDELERQTDEATLTRKQRILRLRVADRIEALAALILQQSGAGAILDEDGFLVDSVAASQW